MVLLTAVVGMTALVSPSAELHRLSMSYLAGQGCDLFKESRQVHDHPVAHHTLGVLVEDAGGHQVQGILGPLVVIDGVASVCAALEHTQETATSPWAQRGYTRRSRKKVSQLRLD